VLAAGAIGSPALLMRSGAPDPHELLGKRTFLHPTVVSAALFKEPVEGYSGAPQTVYSDHFLDSLPLDGPMGFKLEAPPIHPVLAGITLPGHGEEHARWMRELPRLHVLIALLRDGFHPESQGGRLRLAGDGSPLLDYPFTPYLAAGFRHALKSMAEIQFAAGARAVMPLHQNGGAHTRFASLAPALDKLPMEPLRLRVVSAHVMGGCPLGPEARRAVVDTRGRHHQLENLSVIDGSLFPTSIGANPQLSIYALATRLAEGLAADLRR
jgi:choline dehydrogenase-like flavoprotein